MKIIFVDQLISSEVGIKYKYVYRVALKTTCRSSESAKPSHLNCIIIHVRKSVPVSGSI